jgi:hypothetical protein
MRASNGSGSQAIEAVEIPPLIDGDDLRFSRLSTAQGLSQTGVDHIVQDDRGCQPALANRCLLIRSNRRASAWSG